MDLCKRHIEKEKIHTEMGEHPKLYHESKEHRFKQFNFRNVHPSG